MWGEVEAFIVQFTFFSDSRATLKAGPLLASATSTSSRGFGSRWQCPDWAPWWNWPHSWTAFPCHCYLDTTLGPAPPNLCSQLFLLLSWPDLAPVTWSPYHMCLPCDSDTSLSLVGFHPWANAGPLPPAQRPELPRTGQFLRLSPMRQGTNPLPGFLLHVPPSSHTSWRHFRIYQTNPSLFTSPLWVWFRFEQVVRSPPELGPGERGLQGSRYSQYLLL